MKLAPAALTLAAAALIVSAGTAQAATPAASSYAFDAGNGCLALHTGTGIDGYLVDGVFIDLPTTSRVTAFKVSQTGGLQGDYVAVALPGFTVTDPSSFVQVLPGTGCPTTPRTPVTGTAPTKIRIIKTPITGPTRTR